MYAKRASRRSQQLFVWTLCIFIYNMGERLINSGCGAFCLCDQFECKYAVVVVACLLANKWNYTWIKLYLLFSLCFFISLSIVFLYFLPTSFKAYCFRVFGFLLHLFFIMNKHFCCFHLVRWNFHYLFAR